MLFRKLKEGTGIGFSDGAAGVHRLVGARPVEHGYGLYSGSVKEKFNRSWGSRGLAPLGCLPHWGREEVTLAISTPAKKLEGISHENKLISYDTRFLFTILHLR